MDKKKRIKYIDLCKGLGILMVTWGHITKLGNPVDTWTSSFKMSIFFIAAGYLICYTNSYRNLTLKRYAWKLWKSLGVPYILFSIASISFRIFSMIMKHAVNMSSIKSYIFATITLRGVFALWFLPVLLFAEIFFFCIIKYCSKWVRILALIFPPAAAVMVSSILMDLREKLNPLMFERVSFILLPIGKIIAALWFLYIGYIGCKVIAKIKNKYVSFSVGVLFTLINIISSQKNLGVDLNNMALGINPCLFFINGVLGAFGALLVFQFLENYMRFTVLNYFGRNSLILMSTQRPFYIISIGTAGWKIISGAPWVLAMRYYIDCLGAMMIILMLEYFVITFINEKAGFMIGKF